jgi:hypothetical protein
LKQELLELNEILCNNPTAGQALGNNTFKIRLSIKSKGKGKSGGARVITYFLGENREIYLLLIFDKSEFSNVDNKLLKQIIEDLHA